MLQGVFGAALVPLSQAIMADAYPPRGARQGDGDLGSRRDGRSRSRGPTLGGWLTEIASWRWTFYINVPVGALSLFLATQFVPDTVRRARHMDWTGFALMALGIAALQYLLDRGNQRDWFEAIDIRTTALLAVARPDRVHRVQPALRRARDLQRAACSRTVTSASRV